MSCDHWWATEVVKIPASGIVSVKHCSGPAMMYGTPNKYYAAHAQKWVTCTKCSETTWPCSAGFHRMVRLVPDEPEEACQDCTPAIAFSVARVSAAEKKGRMEKAKSAERRAVAALVELGINEESAKRVILETITKSGANNGVS